MAPLLDLSITSIQASLHGRMEAFSTVVNFSLTSTTYNSKFDVWEPLIETTDAFVRCVSSYLYFYLILIALSAVNSRCNLNPIVQTLRHIE
jgi:hypothetical protein